MKINTTRFGKIDVPEEEFILMKGSILGFERLSRFVLLIKDDKTPLWWLQAIDDPAVAFVVINPRMINKDYNPLFYESDLEFLDIKNKDDAALLAIVTIRSQPFRVTVNLRAPLLINVANRMANQIILDDSTYHVQYDVFDYRVDFQAAMSEKANGMERLPKQASVPLT